MGNGCDCCWRRSCEVDRDCIPWSAETRSWNNFVRCIWERTTRQHGRRWCRTLLRVCQKLIVAVFSEQLTHCKCGYESFQYGKQTIIWCCDAIFNAQPLWKIPLIFRLISIAYIRGKPASTFKTKLSYISVVISYSRTVTIPWITYRVSFNKWLPILRRTVMGA